MSDTPEGKSQSFLPIKRLLGASEAVSVQQISIYLPDCDKTGSSIDDDDMGMWIEEALRILSKIGGGASAVRDVLGAWLNPENGELIREYTTIVYTYVDPEKLVDHLGSLKSFIHQFGRETNQGMMLLHFDGVAYRIVSFDGPATAM